MIKPRIPVFLKFRYPPMTWYPVESVEGAVRRGIHIPKIPLGVGSMGSQGATHWVSPHDSNIHIFDDDFPWSPGMLEFWMLAVLVSLIVPVFLLWKRLSFKNCDKLCSYIMRLSVCSCGNDSHHGEKNKHVGSRSCVLLESMVLTFCSCRTWYMDKSIIPSFWCFKAMVHQASCPVGRAGNSRSRRDAQEGWLMVKDGDIIYPIQYAPCMEYVSTFTPKSIHKSSKCS